METEAILESGPVAMSESMFDGYESEGEGPEMAKAAKTETASSKKAPAKKRVGAKAAQDDKSENDAQDEGDVASLELKEDFTEVPHQAKTTNIETILKRIEKGSLIMQPEYQREIDAWSIHKKQGLIESLLMGIIIPNIYIAITGPRHELMDGLQRISTIKQYIEGTFALSPKSRLAQKGLYFQELSEAAKTWILNATITMIEIGSNSSPITPSMKFETFIRLQGGSPLNAIEVIHASFQSPLMSAAKELANSELFTGFFAPRQTKRLKHLEWSLITLIFAFYGRFDDSITIYDDIRNLCTEMMVPPGDEEKDKKVKTAVAKNVKRIHQALEICIEAFFDNSSENEENDEPKESYLTSLKGNVRQSWALVAVGAALELLRKENGGVIVPEIFFKIVEKRASERRESVLSTGASSYEKYRSIMKHILNIVDDVVAAQKNRS